MASKRAAAAAVVFAYESAALSSGRFPTITQLCVRHRWLSAVTVAALIVHLLQDSRQANCVTVKDCTADHGPNPAPLSARTW